jgi:hypothetical protein
MNEALAALVEEIQEGAEKGRSDWRNVANVLTRLIAYSLTGKNMLCNAVEALGYTTLAAVAREVASPSVAELSVAEGRIVVKTKRVMGAINAFKTLAGRKYHPEAKTWSFPGSELKNVCNIVGMYFPMTKVDILALATELGKYSKPAAAPVVAAPVVSVTEAPGGFNIASPYNAAFVADLKMALPYKARAWNGAAKCWWIAKTEMDTVKALVSKHYGATAMAA